MSLSGGERAGRRDRARQGGSWPVEESVALVQAGDGGFHSDAETAVMCVRPEFTQVAFRIRNGLSVLTSQMKFPERSFLVPLSVLLAIIMDGMSGSADCV